MNYACRSAFKAGLDEDAGRDVAVDALMVVNSRFDASRADYWTFVKIQIKHLLQSKARMECNRQRLFSEFAEATRLQATSRNDIPRTTLAREMLAILSREDLSHIISWMPHGRSWRVWKPREFEIKVIPTYF